MKRSLLIIFCFIILLLVLWGQIEKVLAQSQDNSIRDEQFHYSVEIDQLRLDGMSVVTPADISVRPTVVPVTPTILVTPTRPNTRTTFTVYLPIVSLGSPSVKKGLGMTASGCSDLESLRVSWYLNWRAIPDTTCESDPEAEFIPRISSPVAMHSLSEASFYGQDSGWLIGFNEPNLEWQGYVQPDQAAILWREIEIMAEENNLKLVAPTPSQHKPGLLDPYGHQWLWAMVDAYQAQNEGRKPRFDALSWNIYDSDPNVIKTYLESRRAEALAQGYDVPFWVMEYAGACWKSPVMDTGNYDVIYDMTIWFETTPWIDRYAWFANRLPHFPNWESCALVDETGNLTSLGDIYRQF